MNWNECNYIEMVGLGIATTDFSNLYIFSFQYCEIPVNLCLVLYYIKIDPFK